MPKLGIRIHVDSIPTPPEGFFVDDVKFADGPQELMTVTVKGNFPEEEKDAKMRELADWAEQFKD